MKLTDERIVDFCAEFCSANDLDSRVENRLAHALRAGLLRDALPVADAAVAPPMIVGETIKQMLDALNFYANGKNFEWVTFGQGRDVQLKLLNGDSSWIQDEDDYRGHEQFHENGTVAQKALDAFEKSFANQKDCWTLIEAASSGAMSFYAAPMPTVAADAVAPATYHEAAFEADAKRLALELECIMLDCKNTAISAKWWASGMEALEQHQKLLADTAEIAPFPPEEQPDWIRNALPPNHNGESTNMVTNPETVNTSVEHGHRVNTSAAQPDERAAFADDDERALFLKTLEDFEDCNETDIDDRLLMKWACAGLLECNTYLVTEKGKEAFDATRAASQGAKQ